MKVFRVAAVFALLAGPAYAQEMPHINMMPEVASKTQEEKDAEAQRDKAYKESLKKIPDAKSSSDPWGGMRTDAAKTTPAPKTSASAKKTRTGSSAN